MIRFFDNYSLKPHNTFGIDASAKFFFEFTEPEDLIVFLKSNSSWREEKIYVLGEGSNTLFMDHFNGLVIHPNIPGIAIIGEDRQHVWLEVGAGENWDEFVNYTVQHNFGGIENLSLIPGAVGASPVQNIGAYGQEVEQVIERVRGIFTENLQGKEFTAEECDFSYRNSIFKRSLKNQFIITSVIFKLSKFPDFVLSYAHVEDRVRQLGEINLQNIRKAIIDIRMSKLPDVKKLGSAGSFFKNPEVEESVAEKLSGKYEQMPWYPAAHGKVKLAAGWLLEKAGWKGYRQGDAGVHEKQALVLVNYAHATGRSIYDLSEKMRLSVLEQFGVDLEREVNVI